MAAPRSHAEYLALRVFPGLDALRGLSILGVVWHHTGELSPAVPLTMRGFLGVDVFFVLSGFLIVTLLLRERDRHGQISLRDFYLRRALRIFPLYYGVLLGLAVLLWLVPGFSLAGSFFTDLPALLTYTSNWVGVTGMLAVTWSLAAEEQFYLAWPPVERWLGRGWLVPWGLAVLASQLASFRLLDPWLPAGYRHDDLEILQTTFTPILLGVILAHALHDRTSYARLAAWLVRPWVRLGLCVVILALAHGVVDLSGWPRLALHLALAGSLGGWVMRGQGEGWGLLARLAADEGLLARLGRVSYGVYLLHLFVDHVVAQRVLPRLPWHVPGDRFVLCLLATWVLAEVSYRVYERPILRQKHRFSRA
jgi:peptidoglycan/LPS O-acetylase OafA/YrhL